MKHWGKYRLLFTAGLLSLSSVLIGISNTSAEKTDPEVRLSSEYRTPTFIGQFWDNKKQLEKKAAVLAYLNEKKSLFQIKTDVKPQVKIVKQQTDSLGQTHFHLQQVYHGLDVYGADFTIHLNKQNDITTYLGRWIPGLETRKIPTQPRLSRSAVLEKVKKELHVNQLPNPESKLVIYPQEKQALLTYVVKVSLLEPQPSYWHFIIDANSGKIIQKINAIQNVTGQGKGVFGDTKTFEVTCQSGGSPCKLEDSTRGKGIRTYDADRADPNSSTSLPGKIITSNSTTFNEPAGVDAHTYAAQVFDYFKKTFQRNSFDNKGAELISSVHVGNKWNNAAWNGKQMLYGDGDGKKFTNLAAGLDVIGHELTHAVTEHTAGLQYFGESGALNESLSDIFGAMVDREDWLIGEDIYTPNKKGDALRSMSNPKQFDQPDHYKDRYKGWQDNGGVHINSGINNKAAHLIAAGGTHYNVTVKGIGREKVEKIYYRALNYYLTSTSNFAQMRQAVIRAATDLYGANKPEVNAVRQAYKAVGVQ
jgi:Zn-dependent metalloprotease